MTHFEIKEVNASDTWALRQRVLRPNMPIEACDYAEDHSMPAMHLAVVVDGKISGTASVYHQSEDGSVGKNVWRLRGMATSPEVRGAGHGSRLLIRSMEWIVSQGATRIWCNARTSAVGFYKHHDYTLKGDEYEIPGIGPHYLMQKILKNT